MGDSANVNFWALAINHYARARWRSALLRSFLGADHVLASRMSPPTHDLDSLLGYSVELRKRKLCSDNPVHDFQQKLDAVAWACGLNLTR